MKKTSIITAALCASAISTQAAIIAQYNFDNDATHLDADTLDPNVTETGPTSPDFALTVTSESNLFAAEGQGVEDGLTDDMDGAWASGQYIEFTITADAGFTIDLDSLTFDNSRAIRGTNDFAIRTSIDSFAANLVYQNQGTTETATTQTVNFNSLTDFTGLAGTNVGSNTFTDTQFDGLSAITIRIAYDDRESNNGGASATRLDNWTLNGTVVPVPEPSSTALLGLGGLALILRRRK